ncbi:MAG: Xaa-Pro peptidase family protein [Bacillota bacterium]
MTEAHRLSQCREILTEAQADAFLVTDPNNRFYLSGFRGSLGALLVTAGEQFLITDFRYTDQAQEEAPCYKVVRCEEDFFQELAGLCRESGVSVLAFEEDHITYGQYRKLGQAMAGVSLEPLSGAVERLRAVKDPGEVSKIRRAAEIAISALASAVQGLSVGVTEEEVARNLDRMVKDLGASGSAFETIVASGPRSALPHAKPTARRIEDGDIVLVDLGSRYEGYCSDLTRCFMVGNGSSRYREIYGIVLEAQLAGIGAVMPGKTGREVDVAGRSIIEERGYKDQFGHGLGHGVGLAVHEAPRLNPKAEQVLTPGMVVTVEPGIYLPGWGGIRIEDLLLVREEGCEVLTEACPKVLEV